MADYSQIITGSLSVGDNTYAETEILMPQYPDGSVPCLFWVDVEHPPTLNDLDDQDSRWALMTKSNSAVPDLDDSEVIVKRDRHSRFDTSGRETIDVIEHVDVYPPIPITSPKLYFCSDQNTEGTQTIRFRIGVSPRSIPGLTQRTTQNVAQF